MLFLMVYNRSSIINATEVLMHLYTGKNELRREKYEKELKSSCRHVLCARYHCKSADNGIC